uniref:S.cerevisiae ZUO1 zuotin n=1 Tax=Saccharomyces cerevisiae TaxID=4932 RepID=V9H1G1_YEASX|nr:unnamed protein product [Saccharomyces cerevisiae]
VTKILPRRKLNNSMLSGTDLTPGEPLSSWTKMSQMTLLTETTSVTLKERTRPQETRRRLLITLDWSNLLKELSVKIPVSKCSKKKRRRKRKEENGKEKPVPELKLKLRPRPKLKRRLKLNLKPRLTPPQKLTKRRLRKLLRPPRKRTREPSVTLLRKLTTLVMLTRPPRLTNKLV